MNIVKKLFAQVGLDVRWKSNVEACYRRDYLDKWADNYRFLQHLGIRTLLDIGANRGQFVKMISRVCSSLKEIHSFEPLRECQADLNTALNGHEGHFTYQIGLGDKNENVEFNHCEFSPCSSLLEPNSQLVKDHPGAGKIEKEMIQIKRLDDWANDYILKTPLLVKIDVQGYEDKVILGGQNTLSKAKFVILEMPFCQLYKDQPSFHEIYMLLYDLGFVFSGNAGQNISKTDYKILEADALFENKKLKES